VRARTHQKVQALDAGADDYVTQTFWDDGIAGQGAGQSAGAFPRRIKSLRYEVGDFRCRSDAHR